MTRRRLTHDHFPPPPDHAHGPAECRTCRRVITMHTTGQCHHCGQWVTQTTTDHLQPGDILYDWIDWGVIVGIAHDGDRVLVAIDGRPKPIRLRPGAKVWIATRQKAAA